MCMYFCLKCNESHNENITPGNILTTAFVSKKGFNIHAGYCETVASFKDLNNNYTYT